MCYYSLYRRALKRSGFQGSRVDKLRAVDRTNLTLELDKYRSAVMTDDIILGHTAYLQSQAEELKKDLNEILSKSHQNLSFFVKNRKKMRK